MAIDHPPLRKHARERRRGMIRIGSERRWSNGQLRNHTSGLQYEDGRVFELTIIEALEGVEGAINRCRRFNDLPVAALIS